MKAFVVHSIVIAATLIGGDLTFNQGRDSKKLYREVMPKSLMNDGKRAAYHFHKDVTGFIEPVLKRR